MDQPPSTGERCWWGRSEQEKQSSIDVSGLWLSAEVNLLGGWMCLCNCLWAHRLHVYGFAIPLFDPVCCHSPQTKHRDVGEAISSLCGVFVLSEWMFSPLPNAICFRLDGCELNIGRFIVRPQWAVKNDPVALWSIHSGNWWAIAGISEVHYECTRSIYN